MDITRKINKYLNEDSNRIELARLDHWISKCKEFGYTISEVPNSGGKTKIASQNEREVGKWEAGIEPYGWVEIPKLSVKTRKGS